MELVFEDLLRPGHMNGKENEASTQQAHSHTERGGGGLEREGVSVAISTSVPVCTPAMSSQTCPQRN